ncbi:testis-specific serine/threonine-protein kinase 4-like [Anopheles marshallii]|uniref:testis-specific serine/threonine-protein kinase 4-like n=1 Tax=Anopheles marshallii TaxID=1521116 RepID=UPI00237B13DE|nr:testis-specific serine/threonine-protein kinase 4-like [Anopheles marshallii]
MVETQARLDQALQEAQPRTSDPANTLAKSGYIVGETIGQGSFAVVKKAYWPRRNKTVAIKIMSKAQLKEQVLNKYVQRELDAIRSLRHEHIINFYEIIETNMRIYIVMQYAENGSLLQLVRMKTKLTEARVRRYYRQLIDAIHYMHSRFIAHRDIKLDNIVLDKNDQVKLVDFGFSCRVRHDGNDQSSLVQPYLSESCCGSYAYASPEILYFTKHDPIPTDIWASGVVVYALLYGQLPFSNVKDAKIMREIIGRGVKFPSTVKVTDEAKLLLKQIFVPVAQRIPVEIIKRSLWFHLELTEE